MNPRAYDQLNVPTEVEAYIPVQKLFLCCCRRVVFQDRSEKRVIEICIRSRIQSLFILATYTRWPYRGSLGLGLPAVVLWDNHRSIGPVEGQVQLLSLSLTSF